MTSRGCIRSPLEYSDGISAMLGQLLGSGSIASVFALRRTSREDEYCYSLISDPALLEQIAPFHPLMPVQGARALTQLTISEPLRQPVAALLRPCEIRAFVENVKQSQGSMENLLVISCTCPGVAPLKKRDTGIRPSCSACTEFIPGELADMVLLLAADEDVEGTRLFLQSPAAEDLARSLTGFELEDGTSVQGLVTGIASRRRKSRNALLKDAPETGKGLEKLVSVFSRCIGCRACRQACPLCNCIICDYETSRTVHPPELLREESKRRGALRVPSGTLQFHLGRMNHIAPYCIACGQCSDVCPMDIPVAEIFTRAAEMVQETLGYSSGYDIDGAPALSTYRTAELEDITD